MTKERLLVVEDEPITALDELRILTNLGFTVIGIAPSCEEAIRLADSDKPDLVLMDIILEGKRDGIEAACITCPY